MSLQSRLAGASLALGLLIAFSLPAFAQQPSTTEGTETQQQTERMGKRRHWGKDGMHGMMRMFRELNLSDAQQQQARAIYERYDASTKPQREEMRQLFEQKRQGTASADSEARAQALRSELRASHKQMKEELLNILTPEQRTKLDQLKQERKARYGERHGRRQGEMNDNQ